MNGYRLAACAALATALTLTACSEQTPKEEAKAKVPAAAPATPAAPAVEQIELSGLTLADQQANPLGGEIGCYFRTTIPDPLLVAFGSPGLPDPAKGLVKVSGKIELITDPSGFDTMVDGATFNGSSKSVVAVQTTGPAVGGESPSAPATLTYTRADGVSRVYAGKWSCGA